MSYTKISLKNDFDFFPFKDKSSQKIEFSPKLKITVLDCEVLKNLSYDAFKRLSFTFTKNHLENLINACLSPHTSENDKYVLACILKNAEIASQNVFPICQDTGIANVFAWQKGLFLTLTQNEKNDFEALSSGCAQVYDECKLRFSTTCPTSFYEEKDPKNNLPAQISIFEDNACLAPIPDFVRYAPQSSMSFIFCAKGGGSSNKTSFIQGTKALLNPESIKTFLEEQIKKLGTSACPPYTIAVVVGGLSPEQNLLTLKLATAGAYDDMQNAPCPEGFRDSELEKQVLQIAEKTGFGSQFGGKKFALEAIVIRLSRHGASCPMSIGVSCCAHRNLKAVVTGEGIYLEKTVDKPSALKCFDKCISYLDEGKNNSSSEKHIQTDKGMDFLLQQLSDCKTGQRLLLSGKILVARDAAHLRWKKMFDTTGKLPEYTKKYPICYAGPSRTPHSKIIGSFGPTTAGRMDSYADLLMENNASLVTLAKGNRSAVWKNACKKYGGFYLGTPGGIAALIASNYITEQEVIDYEELGMEAVRLITVKDLPCFVLIDKNGNDFYENL
ncbi:fumarate hydratase C-terminal domain-containing protein [Treponema pectinovorum]|uniref:FumA C-terminus/TtdB family hydratase beta subunit n=1 Tax=Treponema pectinovorum TaxID=164 RepID=UPI003D92208B